jgi:hypothetical protein
MSEWVGGSVALTHDIYDQASLAAAVESYGPFLAVTVVRRNGNETVVSFAGPGERGGADERAVREFLNYVLDLSVRARLSADS